MILPDTNVCFTENECFYNLKQTREFSTRATLVLHTSDLIPQLDILRSVRSSDQHAHSSNGFL